jgi:hypothetical protein
VSSPDGRTWEIYAYKIRVRGRDWDPEADGEVFGRNPLALAGLLVWLVSLVPRLIVRGVDVCLGAARALRSDEWTVEAVTFLPSRESYAWSTTREFKGQVLAQVEGHLARGDIPQHLTNGTYLGLRR